MNKQKNVQTPSSKSLPRIEDVLTALTKPGTIYSYPDKPVIFPDSKQSPVKSLDVNVCATQSRGSTVLHKLNVRTKQQREST